MAGFSLVNVNWDFMGKRRVAMVLSLTLAVVSIVSFVVRGFNFGIDFTGGIRGRGAISAAGGARIRCAPLWKRLGLTRS